MTHAATAGAHRTGASSAWAHFFRWATFPAVMTTAALATLAMAGGAVPPMVAQMGTFGIALLALLAAERWLPFRTAWQHGPRGERRTDATSWVMLMAVIDPLMKRGLLPLLLSFTVTATHPAGGLGLFPTAWPFPFQVLLAAAIAELGQYAMHRLAHSRAWMWGVHSFHHSPSRLYWLNGFRVNPLNMVWHQLAGLFVLMLLGAPDAVLQTLILFGMVVSLFQHANADLRYDGWNLVFGTADLHRWHHAAGADVAHCNFGTVLMLWDQVFGTYRRGGVPDRVGIAGEPTWPVGYVQGMWAALQRATARRQVVDR
jgi:sterol desaturase/sphingolipid hydroxylase (fatty acid hydroxylase superfamily)